MRDGDAGAEDPRVEVLLGGESVGEIGEGKARVRGDWEASACSQRVTLILCDLVTLVKRGVMILSLVHAN